MQERSSTNYRLILVCTLIGFPLGVWLMIAQSNGDSDGQSEAQPALVSNRPKPPPSPLESPMK